MTENSPPPAARTPGHAQAALAALVDGHFFSDGPNPLQLVCMTEDDNDIECNTLVSEVEPGTTWNELEQRMATHAAAHHAAAQAAIATAPEIVQLRERVAQLEAANAALRTVAAEMIDWLTPRGRTASSEVLGTIAHWAKRAGLEPKP